MTFIPAANVFDAVKRWRNVDGRSAAAGVPRLAGRFVFDLWGGRYGESREALQRAFRYGLTDAAVVWHNWQRWGYDYNCRSETEFATRIAFHSEHGRSC